MRSASMSSSGRSPSTAPSGGCSSCGEPRARRLAVGRRAFLRLPVFFIACADPPQGARRDADDHQRVSDAVRVSGGVRDAQGPPGRAGALRAPGPHRPAGGEGEAGSRAGVRDGGGVQNWLNVELTRSPFSIPFAVGEGGPGEEAAGAGAAVRADREARAGAPGSGDEEAQRGQGVLRVAAVAAQAAARRLHVLVQKVTGTLGHVARRRKRRSAVLNASPSHGVRERLLARGSTGTTCRWRRRGAPRPPRSAKPGPPSCPTD